MAARGFGGVRLVFQREPSRIRRRPGSRMICPVPVLGEQAALSQARKFLLASVGIEFGQDGIRQSQQQGSDLGARQFAFVERFGDDRPTSSLVAGANFGLARPAENAVDFRLRQRPPIADG